MTWDLFIEVLGFIVGLLYLWFEYHADRRVWLVSIIMPMISLYVYFSRGLYADFGINIYYLLMAIYGYIHWTRASHKEKPQPDKSKAHRPVTYMPVSLLWFVVPGLAAVWAAIWFILVTFTDSTVPVADSFTTALSIVGTWMLARKWVEQWLAWIMVDAVCGGLYIYKGIYFYAVLYAIYTVVAFAGYAKWKRMAASEQCELNRR
ncbi:MAG: nicotinamide riboside transporter PnuC [Muribaculaceae bacterium]|nr:nicotinamide riboside transporter PnuC [Muribaculaceae bacterium]